jgi:hypothetical protein
MLSGSRTRARSSICPPHAGHSSTVKPKVSRRSWAHRMYRHLLPVFCGLGGLLNAAGAGAVVAAGAGAGAADASAGAAGMTRGRQ